MPETADLVSVVIPTYQRRSVLRRAVESAINQVGVRTEIIICDDGSTDGTADDWQNDDRVRFLALPHRGACAARNAGIRAARGAYIAFLDSDDIWMPDKVQTQIQQLKQSRADAVCCAFSRHYPDGHVETVPDASHTCGTVRYESLLTGNFISTQTILGHASLIKQHMFTEDLPRLQDWDYALQLSRGGTLQFFDDVLVKVFVTQDSISSKPWLGLQALDRLWSLHGEAYKNNLAAAIAWQRHAYYFAVQLRQSGRRSYRRTFSEGSWPRRFILLSHAIGLSLRAMLHRIKNKPKEEPT